MSRLLDQLAARYFAQTRIRRGKDAVARRLRPHLGEVRCRTSAGLLMDADPRDLIQFSVLVTGEWEPDETAVVREQLRPGDVFYDIGANVGYFTLLAARLVGDQGHVYAFEPNESTLPKLRHHIELNDLTNVTVLPLGLADRDGHAEFYAAKGGNSGSSAMRPLDDSELTRIEVARLDTVAPERGLRPPDLVKMDIEGAELLALRGMERTLRSSDGVRLLVEITDRFLGQTSGDEAELLAFLEGLDLDLVGEVSRHAKVDDRGRPFQYTALFRRRSFGTEA